MIVAGDKGFRVGTVMEQILKETSETINVVPVVVSKICSLDELAKRLIASFHKKKSTAQCGGVTFDSHIKRWLREFA